MKCCEVTCLAMALSLFIAKADLPQVSQLVRSSPALKNLATQAYQSRYRRLGGRGHVSMPHIYHGRSRKEVIE